MRGRKVEESCWRLRRFLGHGVFVAVALLVLSESAHADSVVYDPLWREVEEADVIVVGTITEVRDQRDHGQTDPVKVRWDDGSDRYVGTIAVLEVIRGDPTLKTVEVRRGLSDVNIGVLKNQAGVWLLMKDEDKPVEPGEWRRAFIEKEFTSFVKIVTAGKKDDSVLDLFGNSESVDKAIVEYASSINLNSPAAIKTASRALASSYWSCRMDAANWLAAAVTTPADAKTALPALIEAANRIEKTNNKKGGNAITRVRAYEAIRSILLRMDATNAEKLPESRGSVTKESLEGSETATARIKSEAVIHRACDLAKHFLRISAASPKSEDR